VSGNGQNLGGAFMDNIRLLISAYLDDELANDERERLATMLPNDAESLDRFACASFIHYQMLDWMGRQQLENDTDSAVAAELHASAATSPWREAARPKMAPSSAGSAQRGAKQRRLSVWSTGALAVSLLVAASVSWLAYMVASRPVIVGQLSNVTASRWDRQQADFTMGSLLQAGQELNLVEGSALITFVSGAQVLLEAPASLRLVSPMELHLNDGRIAAKVPTPARGFTVTSALARFVDLGTAFTLKLDTEKAFQLHVFEGLVELRLDERFGEAAERPLRVAEVRAVSFDVQTGDVGAMHFEEGKAMPF
jgi:hypothetical protein